MDLQTTTEPAAANQQHSYPTLPSFGSCYSVIIDTCLLVLICIELSNQRLFQSNPSRRLFDFVQDLPRRGRFRGAFATVSCPMV